MRVTSALCAAIALATILGFGSAVRRNRADAPQTSDNRTKDLAGIELLRKRDVSITLAQDPAAMTSLWADDGVNLQTPGAPAVGSKSISESYKKFRHEHPGFKVLKYSPDFRDLQLVDGWAIEVIDANATFKMSTPDKPITVQPSLVRVLKREADGSWRFALVGPK